jgi:hypothetical protein
MSVDQAFAIIAVMVPVLGIGFIMWVADKILGD